MSDPTTTAPRVSVVIPCRNEEHYIRTCVSSILSGQEPAGGMEVLVADGMSDDGTRTVLEQLCREHPNVRVLDNPQRSIPCGLNVGIRAARGEVIVRCDAHSWYAEDYVVRCVEALDRSGADAAGGPWIARGEGYVRRVVSAAFRSPFGMGGGKAHDADYEGPVDTVYLGCWRKARLIELGLFDEEMIRNEDDELNLRIKRSGGVIYQSRDVHSAYTPRNRLLQVFRQYYQYGFWKVCVIRKHRIPASPRHLVPSLFVLFLALGLVAALMHPVLAWGYLAVLGLYILGNLAASMKAASREGWDLLPLLPVVFIIFHVAYGLGFLHALLHFVVLRRGASQARAASSLTR